MLKREVIDRHLELFRENAASLAVLMEGGALLDLEVIIRDHMEDLIRLAGEVPPDRRAEVDFLVNHYKMLLRSLTN